MIYKIVCSYLIFCLFVAISLSLVGVSSTTQLGSFMQSALSSASRKLGNWDFSLPRIPQIPGYFINAASSIDTWDILKQMIRIGLMIMQLVNIIITFFNSILFIIEMIIKLCAFITIILEVFDQMTLEISNSTNQTQQAMYLLCSW